MIKKISILIFALALWLPSLAISAPTQDATLQKAVQYYNSGQYNKALPLLEKMLAQDPRNKTARSYLMLYRRQVIEPLCKQAAVEFFKGNTTKAISEWEKVLDITPSNKHVERLIEQALEGTEEKALSGMYSNVDRLISRGKYEDAALELQKILMAYPNEARAAKMLADIKKTLEDKVLRNHYAQADEFFKKGKYDDAIDVLKKILKIDPSQELARKKIIDIRRKKLDTQYSNARKFILAGEYSRAKDMYMIITNDNPTDENALTTSKRLEEFIKISQNITDKGLHMDILRTGLAHHLFHDGEPKVSIAAAWYANQLKPNNPVILTVMDFIETEHPKIMRRMSPPMQDMNLIDQYLFTSLNHIYEGRFDLAVEKCAIILALDEKNIMAMKRMGSAYFLMGSKKRAEQIWKSALRIAPDDPELTEFLDMLL